MNLIFEGVKVEKNNPNDCFCLMECRLPFGESILDGLPLECRNKVIDVCFQMLNHWRYRIVVGQEIKI